jgi:Protein of unknown function (DUF1524)/Excalibur calcium-binding domain
MTPSLRSVLGAATAVATAAVLVTGCNPKDTSGGSGGGDAGTAAGAGGAAGGALDGLTVKGRAPKTGYARDRFGRAWIDTDHNHCDTRDDILRRDLTQDAVTGGCEVTSGVLHDPYTGKVIRYTRGHSEVDIDHLVPLSDAWQKGAAKWPESKREALANDPLNLLAVDASTNRGKGDGDAATWLPPRKTFRCAYVARQIAVKRKYGLWVTGAEKAAMGRVLKTCPGETLPSGGGPVPSGSSGSGSSGSGSAGSSGSSGSAGSGGEKGDGGGAHYRNCDAVRAAGKAPIHRGDPGYSRQLDRDGDGVGCDS